MSLRRKGKKGSLLLGLMFIFFLFSLTFTVANQIWLTQVKRVKEKILFANLKAGQRGIYLYLKERGKLPENPEILFKENYLRKSCLDPFSSKPLKGVIQNGLKYFTGDSLEMGLNGKGYQEIRSIDLIPPEKPLEPLF